MPNWFLTVSIFVLKTLDLTGIYILNFTIRNPSTSQGKNGKWAGTSEDEKSRYIAIHISYRDTILISGVLRYIGDISIYCDTPRRYMYMLKVPVLPRIAVAITWRS